MAGDYDDAADAFERAKRLDPDDWAASYHLALALAAQQKAIRAIGELEALHERHPAAEPPTHSLAALYLAVGCADDAVALLEELATIHPDDDALQSDLQTARRMQNVQTGGPSAERSRRSPGMEGPSEGAGARARIHARPRKHEHQKAARGGVLFILGDRASSPRREFSGLTRSTNAERVVAERLGVKFREAGMGVVRAEPELDKYAFEGTVEGIDCENRIDVCRAACCRLELALSQQDVEEGVIEWEFSRPYLIKRAGDGYCTHLDRSGGCRCGVYRHRPVPCRAYDCRKDTRIRADYERKIRALNLTNLFPEEGEPGEAHA